MDYDKAIHMKNIDVQFEIQSGPHRGDVVQLNSGSCRLIGRHLSAAETSLMEQVGTRVLESDVRDLLSKHIKVQSNTQPDFEHDPNSLTRGPDIVLADDTISRAHAMLFCDGREVGVIDLGSTNGTLVNGKNINSCRLRDGDILMMGASSLHVRVHYLA
jgi:hypothetical protein